MSASIATRTGDDGSTSLLYGQRVSKDHPQIAAVGAFDELNAAIGFAKAVTTDAAHKRDLEAVQRDLVNLMGELVCAEADAERYALSKFPKLAEADLARIDAAIASLEGKNLRFDGWATPGANVPAASLDVARTVARRAERSLAAVASEGRTIRSLINQYANRVADLLWLMARDAERADPAR